MTEAVPSTENTAAPKISASRFLPSPPKYEIKIKVRAIPGSVAWLKGMVLPGFALGTGAWAFLSRILRSSMLEVLGEDYIRTARAKGLSRRRVILRHALKNAMLPVITLIGLQTGFLLSGAVVVEQLFALPGLGSLLVTSVITKDFPQIQGLVLLFALLIVLINILVDLSYAFFDPRVRLS